MQVSGLFLSHQAAVAQNSGMALAWAILIGMFLAVIFAMILLGRGFQGKSVRNGPAWLDWVSVALAVVGIGVALYMTYVEFSSAQAVCGPIGDCNSVQKSVYARILGVPVGLIGVLGYLAILAAWLYRRLRQDSLAGYAPAGIFGMTAFGTLFSIYLTFLEIFVIHAVCIWCLSSAIIMTLLMLLSLAPAVNWLAVSSEEE